MPTHDFTPLDVAGKVRLLADYFTRYPRRWVIETGLYLGWGSTMREPFINLEPERLVLVDVQNINCEQAYDYLRGLRRPVYLDTGWSGENWSAAIDNNQDAPDTFIVRGPSEIALPRVLSVLVDAPALLWLDAHEPGSDCPLREELAAVLAHPHCFDDVVLIDDARFYHDDYYGAGPEYPTLEEVLDLCGSTWDTKVADDVIRCVPAESKWRRLLDVRPTLRAARRHTP